VYKWTTSTKSDYTVTINSPTGGTLTVKDYDDATVSNGASKIKLTVLKFSATPAAGYAFDGVQINNGSTTKTITKVEQDENGEIAVTYDNIAFPTVNDGELTVTTQAGLYGSGTFTAN
jgi:uncharacterized beta-barrel protein YwiB (DUF1934 family)